jgi:hypothetical protein
MAIEAMPFALRPDSGSPVWACTQINRSLVATSSRRLLWLRFRGSLRPL